MRHHDRKSFREKEQVKVKLKYSVEVSKSYF